MGRVFDCVVSHPQHGDVPAGVCWLEEAPRRGEVLILHTPSAEAGENTPAFVPLPASFLVVQVVRHGWDASGKTAVPEGPLPRDRIYLRPLGDDGQPVLAEPGPVPGLPPAQWATVPADPAAGGAP